MPRVDPMTQRAELANCTGSGAHLYLTKGIPMTNPHSTVTWTMQPDPSACHTVIKGAPGLAHVDVAELHINGGQPC